MASGGNVDLVLAVSILSSSLVTLSLGAATVREALAVLFDRLRASPVADRLLQNFLPRGRCPVRDAADAPLQLPSRRLALMTSLVSCLLVPPHCPM